MEAIGGAIGLILIATVVWDIFQTVVVPRPAHGRFRIARNLIRLSWRATRTVALRSTSPRRREGLLGIYAPAIVFVLLVVWIAVLLLGYGLVVYALRDQLRPVPGSVGDAIYLAGTALTTLGFSDVVPTGGPARAVLVMAGATGLGIVALVITFLFSLYGAFQRREVLVVMLDSRAGAPPSGVALLETYARLGLVGELPKLFAEWEAWAAEVLDSHVAFPILGYFRSSHDNESWIGSVGALLDAATLVLTTVEGVQRGHAEMMAQMGEHLVEDVGQAYGFENEPGAGITRMEYDEARDRLAAAGYTLGDPGRGWRSFTARRAHYAARLNLLAELWVSPPSQWIGDRAPIGHHAQDEGGEPGDLEAPSADAFGADPGPAGRGVVPDR